MNIKNIDAEAGIASCSYSEIREKYIEKKTIVFFYCHKRDWVVINEDNSKFEQWKEIITTYMQYSDLQKKEFLSRDIPEGMKKCFRVLNQILRIRRKEKCSRILS